MVGITIVKYRKKSEVLYGLLATYPKDIALYDPVLDHEDSRYKKRQDTQDQVLVFPQAACLKHACYDFYINHGNKPFEIPLITANQIVTAGIITNNNGVAEYKLPDGTTQSGIKFITMVILGMEPNERQNRVLISRYWDLHPVTSQ